MPEANGINDITINTSSESTKTQCEDIGKVWKRNCPDCQKVLYYSDKYKLVEMHNISQSTCTHK